MSYRKAMIANESGADYLISFHRNASPIAGNASGIETLVYADRGVAAQMARDINRELAITAIPFPAARCLFIASGHGSGRPWNTAAVVFLTARLCRESGLKGVPQHGANRHHARQDL